MVYCGLLLCYGYPVAVCYFMAVSCFVAILWRYDMAYDMGCIANHVDLGCSTSRELLVGVIDPQSLGKRAGFMAGCMGEMAIKHQNSRHPVFKQIHMIRHYKEL